MRQVGETVVLNWKSNGPAN